jgi:adenylate kinase family enzyme
MNKHFKRIKIFGRPGSGKSTFANSLAHSLNIPIYHLDKHFFTSGWIERDYSEFLNIQKNIVNGNTWIVDGNSTRSLEMRWSKADLILYFNFPKMICYFRILKRFFQPNKTFDDRATGCDETIRISLLKYIWTFEQRVKEQITTFKAKYPKAVFQEIKNSTDLYKLRRELGLHNDRCIYE